MVASNQVCKYSTVSGASDTDLLGQPPLKNYVEKGILPWMFICGVKSEILQYLAGLDPNL